jgi:hypothetical protein
MVKTNPLTQDELFTLVIDLAKNNAIRQTVHGELRINQTDRNMSISKLMDILSNPKSLITTKWNDHVNKYVYKIQGGKHNRHVVINVTNTYINIVTAF